MMAHPAGKYLQRVTIHSVLQMEMLCLEITLSASLQQGIHLTCDKLVAALAISHRIMFSCPMLFLVQWSKCLPMLWLHELVSKTVLEIVSFNNSKGYLDSEKSRICLSYYIYFNHPLESGKQTCFPKITKQEAKSRNCCDMGAHFWLAGTKPV